ncbi:tyrosine-type recombinase/integrase [Peribacillus butanolivorans]|uniref:tyrosine-type recombinase/integrase n=1 Tax=Peribacillus butanolivorans TaxID=421767 RepID=UPI0036557C60
MHTALPKVNIKEVRPWTQEQAEKFLKVVDSIGEETFYVLAIFTGIRRGEILGLKWEDIGFAQGKIHIIRSLARVSGGSFEGC